MTELASFIDRSTMRYVRVYPHPIELVWQALTDPKEVAGWFLPARSERRVGGSFAFGSAAPYIQGLIERMEPPRLVQYGYASAPWTSGAPTSGAFMRFELESVAGGTRMTFTHHLLPAHDVVADDLGGDLPAGPGTAWRPGFVGGWHLFIDALGRYLQKEPVLPAPDASLFNQLVAEWLKRKLHERELDAATCERYARELASIEEWNRHNVIYREHIRTNIPAN